MQTSTLYRLAGAALAGSALTLAAVTWAERFTGPDLDLAPPLVGPAAGPVHLASFVAFALFLPGLTGLFLAHRDRLGVVGGTAFVLTGLGFWCAVLPHTVLDFGAIPSTVAALPPEQAVDLVFGMYDAIGPVSAVALPLVVLGTLGLGVATWRARVLPRWAATAGLAAVPVAVLLGVLGAVGAPVPHPPFALFLGLAGYGVALLGGAADRVSRRDGAHERSVRENLSPERAARGSLRRKGRLAAGDR